MTLKMKDVERVEMDGEDMTYVYFKIGKNMSDDLDHAQNTSSPKVYLYYSKDGSIMALSITDIDSLNESDLEVLKKYMTLNDLHTLNVYYNLDLDI